MRRLSNNIGNHLQLLANQIKRSFRHVHYPLKSHLFKKSRVELPAAARIINQHFYLEIMKGKKKKNENPQLIIAGDPFFFEKWISSWTVGGLT